MIQCLFLKKDDQKILTYTLIEEARILQKHDSITLDKLYKKGTIPFSFSEVKTSYDNALEETKALYTKYWQIDYAYKEYLPKLEALMSDTTRTISTTSLKKLNVTDSTLNIYRDYFVSLYDQGFLPEEIKKKNDLYKNLYEVCFDLSYDNRELIGDNIENIKDSQYGSNVFGSSTDILVHGTKIAGVIAEMTDSDNAGILQNSLKIMPLIISGYGNYVDKDMALAIRYAVDNGAKVINISQSKDFSLNREFIYDALKYAQKHDVLVVNSAGNSSENLDECSLRYPNDTDVTLNEEFVTSYLVVGASNKHKENLIRISSNYGLLNVDLFAPGEKITTLSPNNKKSTSGGTSYSAVVTSGIAALIRSHYPSLTAAEVKHILMESGVEYDIMVPVPTKDDPDRMLPFNELSKSGKIVNAYNALLMAEGMVKRKD